MSRPHLHISHKHQETISIHFPLNKAIFKLFGLHDLDLEQKETKKREKELGRRD